MIKAIRAIDYLDLATKLGFAILVIVLVLFVIGFGISVTRPRPLSQWCNDSANVTQACIDYRVDTCMATERYTFNQCVTLVGK